MENIKSTLLGRIIYGKVMGFIFGALLATYGHIYAHWEIDFSVGLIIFYVLLGALVAFAGTMTRHPIFGFKTPFYVRGILIGLMMHLMLIFLAKTEITDLVQSICNGYFQNPYWLLIDGSLIGLIIDVVCTQKIGEGNLVFIK